MACPLCSNNLLRLEDLEFCEFTDYLIRNSDEDAEISEIELTDTEINLKIQRLKITSSVPNKKQKFNSTPTSKNKPAEIKMFETSSGNFEEMKIIMNKENIPIIEID